MYLDDIGEGLSLHATDNNAFNFLKAVLMDTSPALHCTMLTCLLKDTLKPFPKSNKRLSEERGQSQALLVARVQTNPTRIDSFSAACHTYDIIYNNSGKHLLNAQKP